MTCCNRAAAGMFNRILSPGQDFPQHKDPNVLAPYMHSKLGTTSPPRFVEEPIEVPNFQTVEEAENWDLRRVDKNF
jgi:hypothetical protein